jgi:ABC-type polysaccharide/polyol phosphate transport system ATPase subunit
MSATSISLQSVSLSREIVGHDRKRQKRTVIHEVNLEIGSGDRIGLIGRNGAGKTTLLRIISGILSPDQGRTKREGQIKSFLDLGYGLEMHLTGRANAYSRSILDGVPKPQREEFISGVEEFSELGDYFDQSLNSYSTGMIARLVFSMCTFKIPEILLIDEGIGTVDTYFQEKALARLDDFYNNSSILIIATHDQSLMRLLCTRGIVMNQGKIAFDGSLSDALDFYHGDE